MVMNLQQIQKGLQYDTRKKSWEKFMVQARHLHHSRPLKNDYTNISIHSSKPEKLILTNLDK
jgi:hypothetical protein